MRHPLLKYRLLCGGLLLAVGANAAAAGTASGRAFPRAGTRAAAAACPDGTISGPGCLEFVVALDLDNNADTGCSFTTEGLQQLSGFEELLTTTVDTRFNPPRVVAVTALSCGSFGPGPVPVIFPLAPPWPVGVGNGIGGANVVETYLPLTPALAGLRRSDTYRIAVTSDAVAGTAVPDDLLTTTGQASGSPILFQLPAVLVPTLGEWGALLLAVLLAAAALLRMRRRGARVLAGLLALSLGIGAAWAIIPDGGVSDWAGIEPLAVNPSPNPAATAGLVAVFAKLEGSLLFLRIDSRFLTLPVAVADAYTTPPNNPLIVAAPGVLQNDQGGGLTAVLAGGPANGTLTLRTNGGFTYQPAPGFTGSDSFSYTAANTLGVSPPVTVTLAVAAPPVVQSTVPANGAAGVPANSTVTVNFSKPVNVTPSAFKLECPAGSPVPFTVTPAPPGGVASFVLHPTRPLPGGLCAVTVLAAQVTDLAAGQHPAADFVFSFTSAPPLVANADRYPETVIGNVSVDSSAIGFSVIRNDVFTGPVTITAFDRVSAGGGAVTMVTSGASLGMFTYNPPAGFQGIDSFTYTLSGAGGSSTATVSLQVAGMIWFIQGGAPAGDGRLSAPFNSLAAFQAVNDGAARHPAAGDNVFLFDSAGGYGGPVSLLAGQKLIGQDATASLAAITGLTPGASSARLPATTGGRSRNRVRIVSSANGINLNRGNLVRGLTLGDAGGVAIAGSNLGTLALRDLSIATTGEAINLSGGRLDAVLTAVSAGGGTHGIALANVTGSFEVTGDGLSDPADLARGRTTAKQGGGALALGSGGTIAGAAGAGVSLDHAGRVTLRNVTLSRNGGDGLTAANLSGLTLDNVLIAGQAANHGLHGTGIAGLTMIHTEVSRNGTAAGAPPPGVENVRLDHLTGTSSVNGSLIANSLGALFQIVESGADAMVLTVANSGFQDSQGQGEGLAVSATDNANVTLTVTGSTFLRHSLNAIHYNGAGSSGGGRISITGSLFDLNRADINVFHAGAGKTLDAKIDGNTTRQTAAGPHDSSILLKLGGAPGAVLRGTITANQVGSATAGSAADLGPGICALASGSGAMIATIAGNTVRQTSNAIFVGSSEETGGTIDVTITGNDLSVPAPAGDSFGIELRAGSLPTDTGLLCANMTGNIAAVGDLGGIQVDTVPGTTVELQGYSGAANDHAAIDAFLGTTATTVAPPAAINTIQGIIKPAAAPCLVPP